MVELRSILLAEDNLSNAGRTFKPSNQRELISVAWQVGASCPANDVLLPKTMHDSH